MKKVTRVCLLVALALILTLTACGPSAPPIQNLDDTLQPIRDMYELPALAAVVISNGNIIAEGAVGVRRYGDPTPVTTDDQWLISSCSKSMTATMMAILVEQGKVSWTNTMAEVFPEIAGEMLPKYKDVNLLELLSHHAGMLGQDSPLPSVLTNVDWNSLNGTETQLRYLYTKLLLCQSPGPEVDALPEPGTTFLYSNVGYVIAGAVAERVTGKSWEELMTTLLFQPLGMTTAGFGPPGKDSQVDQPWCHLYYTGDANHFPQYVQSLTGGDETTSNYLLNAYSGDNIIPIPPDFGSSPVPDVTAPAGSVHMSLKDWAKFVNMHIEGEKGGSNLLKSETFKVLHTQPFGGDYALGWFTSSGTDPGGAYLWHFGSHTINYAEVWMLQSADFAVLVATNIGNPDAESAVKSVVDTLVTKYSPKK